MVNLREKPFYLTDSQIEWVEETIRSMSDEEKAAFEEEIPAGRMGTPEEAAEFTYHIATAPAYMTGQIVTFDGAYL